MNELSDLLVSADMVRRLGGANEALVFALISWKCELVEASKTDRGAWFTASHSVLAEETGLTEKQARNAIETLVIDGHVRRAHHYLTGRYDRTYSYQPVR